MTAPETVAPDPAPRRRATSRPRASSSLGALGEVARDGWSRAVFILTALGVSFVYSVLLPFDYTQRVSFHNWSYLDATLIGWALALGAGMALVVSVQVHAVRRLAAARLSGGVAGGLGFVGSLVPSLLCCSPIIPSTLAFVGVSGASLYGTTGTLQHFFATHQVEFLGASLALLALTGWWGLRKIARSLCLSPAGCDRGTRPEASEVHADRRVEQRERS